MAAGQVSERHIREWLDATSPNPITRHTYWTRVRVFCRWLVAQGELETDPSQCIVLGKRPDKLSAKLITEYQVEQLLTAAGSSRISYMGPVIRVTYELALRLGEVCALRWSWVDLARQTLTSIQSTEFSTKSGTTFVKPISGRAMEIFLAMPPGGGGDPVFRNSNGSPLEPKQTSKAFKRLVRRCGLPETVSFHSLRHGALSRLALRGAGVEELRRFAGHASISMTMRYLHLSDAGYLFRLQDHLNGPPGDPR